MSPKKPKECLLCKSNKKPIKKGYCKSCLNMLLENAPSLMGKTKVLNLTNDKGDYWSITTFKPYNKKAPKGQIIKATKKAPVGQIFKIKRGK